ncbi:MAG: ATP-dependent DNA helicase RecG [bacterium]|nr:ATP-dependent DNA helicase RecG [bacterium]
MIPLETPLSGIRGVPSRIVSKLEKLGIKTARDLLWHFPSRYEDFSTIYKIADLEPGQHATIQGVVETVDIRRSWQKRMIIVEATISDDTGTLRAIWFNQPYMKTALRIGRVANFAGKVTLSDESELYMSHPLYELITTRETKHTGRLVPIYPETQGLTSKGIRFLLKPILQNTEEVDEWLPAEIFSSYNFPEVNDALKKIHFPQSMDEASAARDRFSFEDLYLLQLLNLKERMALMDEKAPQISTDLEWLKGIIEKLPFELTVSQKKSLWEILQDLEKGHPMNRLLQGDVGSGKTVIAALAALVAAKHGYQTAFMAPTEVLAQQHFITLQKLFHAVDKSDQTTVGLLTAGGGKIFYETDVLAEVSKKTLTEKLGIGEIGIVVGTHALIQKGVHFKNLGFVIVDEQHRFGVEQRAALAAAGDVSPHFLSMSATPIPRTLMLTVFGNLDISTITELPKGRQHIETKIVPPSDRQKTYNFVRTKVREGRQAFVICPRIERAEPGNETPAVGPRVAKKLETKSVKEEYEKLSKKVFPDLRVGMLHGQLKPKEKAGMMRQFSDGLLDILVSTSVIEVGVDIPNAVIMMIEGSERFGLSQLYQFRGRVGRGEHQSHCLLFTDSESESVKIRLQAILEAKNGFELAEKDLALRGPGEFLGDTQTGMPDLAMKALQNPQLVKHATDAARATLERDSRLAKSKSLRARLKAFEAQVHAE